MHWKKKCRKCSKFDLAYVDLDSIDVRDVKYHPPSFDSNVIFVLSPFKIKFRVRPTYGCGMDGMDKLHDGHPWCMAKTTNIHHDYGLSVKWWTCTSHLQCPHNLCDYLIHIVGMQNCTEWSWSTHISFCVGVVARENPRLVMSLQPGVPSFACIVHSMHVGMTRACIHFGVHNHHVSSGTCCETLDIVY